MNKKVDLIEQLFALARYSWANRRGLRSAVSVWANMKCVWALQGRHLSAPPTKPMCISSWQICFQPFSLVALERLFVRPLSCLLKHIQRCTSHKFSQQHQAHSENSHSIRMPISRLTLALKKSFPS